MAEYGLDWNILSSTNTDGAPAMVGQHSGVATKLKQKTSGNFVGSHCIIHQESLASKHLKMHHVMQPIIKIVNFIRSRGLNHRQFRQFLQDLDEKFSDVPYFTEVRWLSRGVVLERFFALRDPIQAFMLEKGNPIDYDNDWRVDCAFLVDMNKHLTDLNVNLQGKNLIVTQMYSCIQAFETKLRLWENQVKNQTSDHFPHLKSFGTVDQKKLDQYSQLLQNLITELTIVLKTSTK
uniref:General transcription factor II-I repeat domain-containing protein 2-like n=1 Tax=Diabrotica virgifera virgifera TaxID=50390 RepID=A0A6P7GGF7_DIAVI